MAKRKEIDPNKPSEVRIYGVAPSIHNELVNISDHIGIDLSSMLKPKLREIRDSYPAHMRIPPPKY